MNLIEVFMHVIWDALFLIDPDLVPGYWGG